MQADKSEKGKNTLSAYITKFKKIHRIVPGPDGVPFASTTLFHWIVDLLHVDLNEGKLTWKWALVRKLPADVRHEISALLISYGLGLDLRTKEEGRVAQDKFYDGGEWHKFISGSKKSPRGERIIAEIVLIVATHYERLLKSAEADRLARVAAPPAPAASQPKKSARNPKPASSKPTKASR